MGARSVLSRALTATAAVALAACIDFVEPDIEFAGAPATVEAVVRVTNDTIATLSARMMPGFDEFGIGRRVTDPLLRALDQAIAPDTVLPTGERRYAEQLRIAADRVLAGVVIGPPSIEGVGSPGSVRWHGVRRLGPDTLRLEPGDDLSFALELPAAEGEPRPGIRQWFLTLSGDEGIFRLAADGVPPALIQVPRVWVPPPSADGIVTADLIYFQSAILRSPANDYLFVVTLDVRMRWIVRIDEATSP